MKKPDFLQGRLFYILQAHRKTLLIMLAVALLAVGAVVVFSGLPTGDTPPAAALTGGSTPVPEIVEPDTLSSEDFVTRVLPDGTCAITAWKGTGTSVTIPAKINGRTVTVIEDNVFLDKTALTSVTLPEGLTTLGDYAFYGCKALTSVTLPEGLTTLATTPSPTARTSRASPSPKALRSFRPTPSMAARR